MRKESKPRILYGVPVRVLDPGPEDEELQQEIHIPTHKGRKSLGLRTGEIGFGNSWKRLNNTLGGE